ncbi:hypothetical protein PIB30_058098 [Stylosanthes scabra]|uniref:Uncharacterized protein n=2 Tax=50 kb inversion clade TaxID=2231393 RepID=A0ABU6WI40_9FABA|nr:hypothetical protein [Stylosanthes scabra]
MAVMEKLKMFVVQEPVVAASCLIAGFGLFLPAVVRPMLDSYQASKQPPQAAFKDILICHERWKPLFRRVTDCFPTCAPHIYDPSDIDICCVVAGSCWDDGQKVMGFRLLRYKGKLSDFLA